MRRVGFTGQALAATIGLSAALGLLVAVGSFCHRIAAPPQDATGHDGPWTGFVAVCCLAGWAATQTVSAASRGALVRFDLSAEGQEDLLRLVLGFAEYVNALGLVLLCAGAILVAATVPTRWFGGWDGNVRATAVFVGLLAGAAAVASAAYLPKADRTFETNAFRPGNPIHGAVTIAWFVLLVCLAVDGVLRTDDAR